MIVGKCCPLLLLVAGLIFCFGCSGGKKPPALPPSLIPFVSDKDETMGEIYLARLPGGTPQRITKNVLRDYSPALSPDGRRLVFVQEDDRGRANLMLALLSATFAVESIEPLTDDARNNVEPCWSSDGATIFYHRDGDEEWPAGIYQISVNGSEPLPVIAAAENPSPARNDPTMIAYTRLGENLTTHVYRMRLNDPGNSEQRLSSNLPPGLQISTLAWSPDGSQIAFGGYTGAGSGRVFLLSAAGGSAVALTPASMDCGAPLWLDANYIAFFGKENSTSAGNLYAIHTAGGAMTLLLGAYGNITRSRAR